MENDVFQKKVDYLFKVVLLGHAHVGKTSFANRFCDHIFSESYSSTVGIDFRIKTMMIENCSIKMQIWDTAGQEKFQSLTKSMYQGAHGCFVLFDLTSMDSLIRGKKYVKIFFDNCPIPKECVFLVGNKCDLKSQREVSYVEGEAAAKEMEISYLESSAKDGTNIEECFAKICQRIFDKKEVLEFETKSDSKHIKLDLNNTESLMKKATSSSSSSSNCSC